MRSLYPRCYGTEKCITLGPDTAQIIAATVLDPLANKTSLQLKGRARTILLLGQRGLQGKNPGLRVGPTLGVCWRSQQNHCHKECLTHLFRRRHLRSEEHTS